MWKEFLTELAASSNNVRMNPPAARNDVLEVENKLDLIFPQRLKNLLSEFNGDNYFILSTKEIIEVNTNLRKLTCYMPLNCLLFIAGNGCGDYFGYAITGEGINDSQIYMWDHESDNRVYIADGLKDLIEKYYTDQI